MRDLTAPGCAPSVIDTARCGSRRPAPPDRFAAAGVRNFPIRLEFPGRRASASGERDAAKAADAPSTGADADAHTGAYPSAEHTNHGQAAHPVSPDSASTPPVQGDLAPPAPARAPAGSVPATWTSDPAVWVQIEETQRLRPGPAHGRHQRTPTARPGPAPAWRLSLQGRRGSSVVRGSLCSQSLGAPPHWIQAQRGRDASQSASILAARACPSAVGCWSA